MPWIPFTTDHVKPHLADRELAKFEAVASAQEDEEDDAPDAPPRLPLLVAQVCNRFRGAIISNPRASYIGPDGTLPDWLIHAAAILCRRSVISMLPVEEGYTDPRKDEYDAAEKELESLRSRDPKAFDPESPVATGGGSSFGGKRKLCW